MSLFHYCDAKLEGIWQPLYDTQSIPAGQSTTAYFQFPHGRGLQYTNLESPGQLISPKKFTVWGIEINFVNPVSRKDQAELAFQFIVGEVQYICSSLLNFREVEPGVCFYLPLYDHGGETITRKCFKDKAAFDGKLRDARGKAPIWIPSLQNFRTVIQTSPHWGHADEVRVQLIGELLRPIQ